LPVDGGTYEITARLYGAEPWTSRTVVKAEGDTKTITIPKLSPAIAAPPPPTTTTTATGPSRVLPITLAIGAVALGGGALGFELWGRSQHDDAQATLDGGNPTRANELQDSANTKRYLAQAFGVAAIGCAAVSIVLFVRGGGDEKPSSTAMRIAPHAGGDNAGLTVWGAW
jgi:hypothetical protein